MDYLRMVPAFSAYNILQHNLLRKTTRSIKPTETAADKNLEGTIARSLVLLREDIPMVQIYTGLIDKEKELRRL